MRNVCGLTGAQKGNELRKEMLYVACSPYDEPLLLLTAGTKLFS